MTLHLDRGRHEPLCGHYFAGDYCTVKAERVTCKRCLARMAARACAVPNIKGKVNK